MAAVQNVPQADRLGKKDAWAALKALPIGELDSNPSATFKWWLWLGHLGAQTPTVVGAGMTKASLTYKDEQNMVIRVRRSDMSEVDVCLSKKAEEWMSM